MEKQEKCWRGHWLPPCKACMAVDRHVEDMQAHVKALKERGLSNAVVARMVGIGKTTVWRWLHQDETAI